MCRSDEYYKDADTFNPSRYLDPASPQYKEPLTEYPKIQGHTVFGWGRRVCVGMEYAATQMLVICAAVSYSFNIDVAIDPKTNQKYHLSIDDATANVIPVLSQETGSRLLFSLRSGSRAQELRNIYRLQREQDQEKEEEECY